MYRRSDHGPDLASNHLFSSSDAEADADSLVVSHSFALAYSDLASDARAQLGTQWIPDDRAKSCALERPYADADYDAPDASAVFDSDSGPHDGFAELDADLSSFRFADFVAYWATFENSYQSSVIDSFFVADDRAQPASYHGAHLNPDLWTYASAIGASVAVAHGLSFESSNVDTDLSAVAETVCFADVAPYLVPSDALSHARAHFELSDQVTHHSSSIDGQSDKSPD